MVEASDEEAPASTTHQDDDAQNNPEDGHGLGSILQGKAVAAPGQQPEVLHNFHLLEGLSAGHGESPAIKTFRIAGYQLEKNDIT